MATVEWTTEAASDLEAIRRYVGQDNPVAAVRLAGRLFAAAERLNFFPNRGRPAAGGRRELTSVWPYIIRYSVAGERVVIERIRHGARRPD